MAYNDQKGIPMKNKKLFKIRFFTTITIIAWVVNYMLMILAAWAAVNESRKDKAVCNNKPSN